MEEIVALLNQFQPHVITGYSSGNYQLALEQLKGNLTIAPQKVFCSGDNTTPATYAALCKAFNVEPINFMQQANLFVLV